jgi:hypothetical protein
MLKISISAAIAPPDEDEPAMTGQTHRQTARSTSTSTSISTMIAYRRCVNAACMPASELRYACDEEQRRPPASFQPGASSSCRRNGSNSRPDPPFFGPVGSGIAARAATWGAG